MNRVLITGGTGFVGHWLKQTEPENIKGTYIGRAMYDNLDWKKFPFDAVIHAAPVSPVHAIEYSQYYNVRVLYISSGIVYHPESTETDYRQLKLDGEKDCIDSGIDAVIARLFTFYGDRLDDNKAYTHFVKAARENRPLVLWGDGQTTRSYMHGHDMALRLWALLECGERGQAYDVGDTEPITLLELAQAIIEQYQSDSKIEFVDRFVPMPRYLPENVEPTEKVLKIWEWWKRTDLGKL